LGGENNSEGSKLKVLLSGFTHSDSASTSSKPVVTSRDTHIADVTAPTMLAGMATGHEEKGTSLAAFA